MIPTFFSLQRPDMMQTGNVWCIREVLGEVRSGITFSTMNVFLLRNVVLPTLVSPHPHPKPSCAPEEHTISDSRFTDSYDVFSPREERADEAHSFSPLCEVKEGDKPKVGGEVARCPRPHASRHKNQPPAASYLELGTGAFWASLV